MVGETVPDDIGVSVSYPLPGTKFHQRVAAQLEEKRNWSDSDDLAMMFRGSYTNHFYQALHDALHLEVEIRKENRASAQSRERLRDAWSCVEKLEKSSANPNPTALWTFS